MGDCLEKLGRRFETTGARLCIGLDPDRAKMPAIMAQGPSPLFEFCRRIVVTTAPYAAAYKPNLAFFEAQGSDGIAQLEELVAEIPEEIPVILDAKRGDIGNTAAMYARFVFEHLDGDGTTVSPYLGGDSLEPFFAYPGKLPFVLCLTSNPGSDDLQTLVADHRPVFQHVIALAERHRKPFGLVVGARHAGLLQEVRRLAPMAPLLIPGIGAQGGDLYESLRIAAAGRAPVLINVSRDILYASSGEDFAEAAAAKARWYAEEMKRILSSR
ncbi:MAG: orotidine-5'-phosphate decarboxylase [Candidatus Zixiibacteriota bacterium]